MEPEGLSRPGRRWVPPAAVFGVALAVRLPYLFALASTPFLAHPVLDARFYDLWAQRIAAGEWLGREVFFANPLYPYWLGALYALFGRHLFLVHLLQHLLGCASAALLVVIGTRLWDRRVGLLAGLGAALYAPFVFHEGSLMIESLAPFLATAALALAVRTGERRSPQSALGAGLAHGVFVLARPNATPLAAAGWVAHCARRDRSRARPPLLLAALVLFGTALAIAPVTLRNWVVSHTFVPITAHGGEAFYVGNHALADGYGTQPDFVDSGPATEHESYRREASRILGRPLTLAESSAYWRGQAVAFARAEPERYLALLARKIYLFCHSYERGDNQSFNFTRAEIPALGWIPLTFGLVLPLSGLGLLVTRRDWSRMGIVPLHALTYAAGVILFFVTARYRLAVVPALLLLAAAAIGWGRDAIRTRRFGPLAAGLGLVLALAIIIHWPSRLVTPEDLPTIRNNYGLVLEESGDLERARAEFQAAMALAPERALYPYNLALVERRRGDEPAARAALEHAIALDPAFADAYAELGRVLELTGDLPAALVAYERAMALAPSLIGPALNAAVLLEQAGRSAEAAPLFQRALALNPAAYRENLGWALYLTRHGRGCEALPYFTAARQVAPATASAQIDSARAVILRTCPGMEGQP